MLPYIYPFGIQIAMYKLALLASIIAVVIHYILRRNTIGFSTLKAGLCGLSLLSTGFVGMKMLYLVQNLDMVQEMILETGGLFFYGAVFLIPITLPFWAKVYGVTTAAISDYGAPDMLLSLGIVRIGCMCAGCCGGITLLGTTIPVQMIEAGFDFLILGRLLNREIKYEGELYPRFMIEYGTMRFFIEFIRASDKSTFGLSVDQWLSILSVIIGLGVYQYLKNKGGQKNDMQAKIQ